MKTQIIIDNITDCHAKPKFTVSLITISDSLMWFVCYILIWIKGVHFIYFYSQTQSISWDNHACVNRALRLQWLSDNQRFRVSDGTQEQIKIFVCVIQLVKKSVTTVLYVNGNMPFHFQTGHIQIFLFNFVKGIILTLWDFSSKKIMTFFPYLTGIHKLSAEK